MVLKFREQFSHFTVPSRDIEQAAFVSGLIVLDANVLLNVYRFAPESRDELIAVIERLRERIWIPHQVGHEFYKNRIVVMAEIRGAYGTLKGHVVRANDRMKQDIEGRINQLANRVLLQDERASLSRILESALEPLLAAIDELGDKHELLGSYADDPILDRLEQLLEDRIGAPFSPDEEREKKEEAARRMAAEPPIPPGFEDRGKPESHGDYFVWAQALAQAKALDVTAMLLVTDDKKEDWYLDIRGQKVSALPYLAEEAMREAGCHLVMLDTAEFLARSRTYVDADVSAETIREAEGVPRQRVLQERVLEVQVALNSVELAHNHAVMEAAQLDHEISRARAEHDQLTAMIEEEISRGGEPAAEAVKMLEKYRARSQRLAHMSVDLDRKAAMLRKDMERTREVRDELHAELRSLVHQEDQLKRAEGHLHSLRAKLAVAEEVVEALRAEA